jgi:DNA-binding NarL/FixJ family response regulator
LHEIGRAFGKEHHSLSSCRVTVGLLPAVRRRSEISRGLASGSSMDEIAKRLNRVVSTESWEVTRHGGLPE